MAMNSRNIDPCSVCGAPAIGYNFAVPTCAPCKAFFRRNAVKLGRIDFVCQADGDCPVTFKYRRICNCCRLAKCFRVGMQKSLILSQAEKEARNQIVQQNREKRAQSAKKQKSISIRPLTVSHLTQNRLQYLLPSDQALLTNIFGAYNQSYSSVDDDNYPSFPRREHSSLHTFYNEYEERYKLFLDYCQLIPEFNRLSIDDKKHLLKNHLVDTIVMSDQVRSKSISQNLLTSLKNVYDPISANALRQIVQRLFTYTYDPMILKLVLVIQTLSSGIKRYFYRTSMIHIYDDPLVILAGQNIYVELLWRYLLSRLSCEQDVVKFFNKLILDLLFLQRTSVLVERYICNLNDEIDRMNPLMQSLWHM